MIYLKPRVNRLLSSYSFRVLLSYMSLSLLPNVIDVFPCAGKAKAGIGFVSLWTPN